MKRELTAARLREMFHYDPETGVFTHLRQRKGRAPGAVLGWLNKDGYMLGHAGGKNHRLHRLAWLYVTGRWPAGQVDHVDGIRSDNRFCKLRDVTHLVNVQNRHAPRPNSKAGLLGVSYAAKKRKHWRASIAANGAVYHLGYFALPEQAHAAYVAAKRVMHPESSLRH